MSITREQMEGLFEDLKGGHGTDLLPACLGACMFQSASLVNDCESLCMRCSDILSAGGVKGLGELKGCRESECPLLLFRRYALGLAATAVLALIGVIAVAMHGDTTQEPVALAQPEGITGKEAKSSKLWSKMPDPKAVPTWKPGATGIVPAGAAKGLPIDYRSMFMSDMFAVMSDTCCRTIFFPPGHGPRLPMDFELDGPFAKRIRNFVAKRNSFLFVGADRYSFSILCLRLLRTCRLAAVLELPSAGSAGGPVLWSKVGQVWGSGRKGARL